MKLPQEVKLLPLMFCGAALFLIAQGQWAQPSMLGCAVITVGLLEASINIKLENKIDENSTVYSSFFFSASKHASICPDD